MSFPGLLESCRTFLVEATNLNNCWKQRCYGKQHRIPELIEKAEDVIISNFQQTSNDDHFTRLRSGESRSILMRAKTKVGHLPVKLASEHPPLLQSIFL